MQCNGSRSLYVFEGPDPEPDPSALTRMNRTWRHRNCPQIWLPTHKEDTCNTSSDITESKVLAVKKEW